MNNNFTDLLLSCSQCGSDFTYFATEQDFFAKLKAKNPEMKDPKRCPRCREERKAAKEGNGNFQSAPRFSQKSNNNNPGNFNLNASERRPVFSKPRLCFSDMDKSTSPKTNVLNQSKAGLDQHIIEDLRDEIAELRGEIAKLKQVPLKANR